MPDVATLPVSLFSPRGAKKHVQRAQKEITRAALLSAGGHSAQILAAACGLTKSAILRSGCKLSRADEVMLERHRFDLEYKRCEHNRRVGDACPGCGAETGTLHFLEECESWAFARSVLGVEGAVTLQRDPALALDFFAVLDHTGFGKNSDHR